jgi:hypothetical protein
MCEIKGVSAMAEIHYEKPRSGVVEDQLDELNYSLHYVLTLHTWMPRIQCRSMWKYTKQVFMAMNRQIQMWLHPKSCHSHEKGLVKPVSKSI